MRGKDAVFPLTGQARAGGHTSLRSGMRRSFGIPFWISERVFELGKPCVQISQGASELCLVAGIAARFQIRLHTRPGKKQHFSAAVSFNLCRCHPPIMISGLF